MSVVIRSMVLLDNEARADRRAAVGHGGDKLKALSQRRDMMRKGIEARGERAAELSEDLAEVNNRHDVVKFFDGVFGQDPAGAVNEKQSVNQAEIERTQAELEVLRSDEKSIFRDIERAEKNTSGVGRETQQMLRKRERTIRDDEL